MRPASLGLVVDLSGSMRHKIAKVQAAVEALLQNLEPEDEEFLVTFADRPELRLPFTSDISAIRAALSFAEPHGWTALFDAIALAVQQMRRAQNRRRVLFLISDGGDNYSRLTRREFTQPVGRRGRPDSCDRHSRSRGQQGRGRKPLDT